MKCLHEVVLDALELHGSYELPTVSIPGKGKRLVVASGNALPTGKIIFLDEPAIFADESQYQQTVEKNPDIASATVVSASGRKHAPIIIRDLLARGIEVSLFTCDRTSPAAILLSPDRVVETKSNEEAITYNTSTYLGIILAKTREDPAKISEHLLAHISPLLEESGDLRDYAAFYLIVKPEFDIEREMFLTKFDELFGGRLNGRCYSSEQTLHAKTLVPWEKEIFISFGYENRIFGEHRINLPLPDGGSFAAMLSVGYYVIGHIQAQFPPWFKENAAKYAEFQKRLFEAREIN